MTKAVSGQEFWPTLVELIPSLKGLAATRIVLTVELNQVVTVEASFLTDVEGSHAVKKFTLEPVVDD